MVSSEYNIHKFKNQEIIVTKGLPGSGKSTFSKDYCEKNPNYIRVSRDDIRHMRGKYWLPKQEKLITKMEHLLIRCALEDGKSVVVDATNLKEERVNEIRNIAKDFSAKVTIKDFTHVTPEECIKRDSMRKNPVGAKMIWHFYDEYLRPKYEVVRDTTLPHAIIVDLDGTLCIHNGRSPYDEHLCDTDLVNEVVRQILWTHLFLAKIIFVSGRHDSVKDKTILWLQKNFGADFELHMRKADDNRNDSIVKREIFMEHINGKYFIDFVLDDRDRVVSMWRKDLGLTCFQVNYGDF